MCVLRSIFSFSLFVVDFLCLTHRHKHTQLQQLLMIIHSCFTGRFVRRKHHHHHHYKLLTTTVKQTTTKSIILTCCARHKGGRNRRRKTRFMKVCQQRKAAKQQQEKQQDYQQRGHVHYIFCFIGMASHNSCYKPRHLQKNTE